ncbi:MAG: oligoendopeptidase F [Verrucomicrobiales bacterium]|nr:oligoendopeptidase F [Verrucomicrobiota bacterium JB025]
MRLPLPIAMLALAAGPVVVSGRAGEPEIPDFSETPRSEVPEQFTFKLDDVFKDKDAWRAEFEAVKNQCDGIAGTLSGWDSSAEKLAAALELDSSLSERLSRLYAYARLINDMDLSDAESTAMMGEVSAVRVAFATEMSFIDAGVIALGEETVRGWIDSEPRLEPFRFPLEKILLSSDHVLTEAEQTIVSQMGLFVRTPGKVSGLLNDVDIPPAEIVLTDGTPVTLNRSNYLKHRTSRIAADRKLVNEAFWKNLEPFQNSFAALLDGEMKKQVATARIHNFESCLEASLFDNDIDPEVYHNLISTVRANLEPLHRLFRLKQKMLGLSSLHSYDTIVPASPAAQRKYSFDEARELVLSATEPLGEDYRTRLLEAFDGRWVDIYPNEGKQSGAYSMGIYGAHPYIKLNYTGRLSEVSTLAHELGHSMHAVFSNETQPFATARYPVFIAEIASTFNEVLLLRRILDSTDDDHLKLQLLEGFLHRMRGLIYHQTMYAEFELAMHEKVENGHSLTADWLNDTYMELFRDYMGADDGVIALEGTSAVAWSAVPHFFRPFYVYQYATGMVASTALADAVLTEGEPARERYLGLLRSGGSKHPLDLLKDAGIDMSQPAPVLATLEQFDSLVTEMEKIYDGLPAEEKQGTSM